MCTSRCIPPVATRSCAARQSPYLLNVPQPGRFARGGDSYPTVTVGKAGWVVGVEAGRTAGRSSSSNDRRRRRDRHFASRLRRFTPIPAFLVGAGDVIAFALRVFREQVRLSALRARTGDRFVPGGELAVRVVHAAVERLAETRLSFGEAAAAVGADHAFQRDRARRLAGRIVAAGEEPAEPAALVDHRLATGRARLVGRNVLDDPDLAVLLDEILGVLAVGIAGAGEEPSHPAPLDHHRAA